MAKSFFLFFWRFVTRTIDDDEEEDGKKRRHFFFHFLCSRIKNKVKRDD